MLTTGFGLQPCFVQLYGCAWPRCMQGLPSGAHPYVGGVQVLVVIIYVCSNPQQPCVQCAPSSTLPFACRLSRQHSQVGDCLHSGAVAPIIRIPRRYKERGGNCKALRPPGCWLETSCPSCAMQTSFPLVQTGGLGMCASAHMLTNAHMYMYVCCPVPWHNIGWALSPTNMYPLGTMLEALGLCTVRE